MKVTSEIKGLGDLSNAFQMLKGATDTVLEPAAKAGAEVVKESADQDGPGPYNAIETKKVSQKRVEVLIGPNKKHWYYLFHERGAARHEIKPSKKKALAWPGGPVVKRVNHPGHAADPFLVPALENNRDSILEAIAAKLRSVIR